MPRHAQYVPHGVIPAVLLPFHDDLSIDEKSFRSHLRDVAATKGISAITVNAHSTEVASCTFDEQRRVLEIAQDEVGDEIALAVDLEEMPDALAGVAVVAVNRLRVSFGRGSDLN